MRGAALRGGGESLSHVDPVAIHGPPAYLPSRVKPLSHPDNLYVSAAEGWLMLGDARSAREELAKLSPKVREEAGVAELEWTICARAEDWIAAFAVAEQMVQTNPERSFGWVHRAYAARRMPGGGLARAWALLRPAAEKFPKEHLIPYNLACYAAQSERLEEAWDWLQRARDASGNSEEVKAMALVDDDLRPLWGRLSGEGSKGPP